MGIWTNLGQPASAPTTPDGAIDGLGIATSTGKIVVPSPGEWDGTFPGGFTARRYNTDFTVDASLVDTEIGSDGSAYMSGGTGGAVDAAGNLYYLWHHGGLPVLYEVMKCEGATLTRLWTDNDFGSVQLRYLAVNQAGTTLYITSDTGGSSGDEKVYKIDLTTGALSVFKTGTSASVGYQLGPPLVLADDSIIIPWGHRNNELYPKHYDAAGTLLHTYSGLPNWESQAVATGIAHAYTGTTGPAPIDANSFFIGYYAYESGSPVPGYGVNIVRVNLTTGAVIGDVFQTPSSSFEYDSVFAALNTPIGAGFPVNTLFITGYGDAANYEFWGDVTTVTPTPPTTPPAVLVNSTPCCDDSPGGPPNAGPVLPPVNMDWIPSCTGGGLVPTVADLVLTEMWDY